MNLRETTFGLLLVLSSAACGGPATGAQTGPGPECEAARGEAATRWDAVATAAEAEAAPPDRDPLAAETALDRLQDHLAALREAPREVDGEEAMALSSAVMDGIDEVGADLPTSVRERADDAAEALLTDRSEQGAVRATQGAILALESVLDEARPGSGEERRARDAARDLARRSRRAAEAYAAGVREGDRAADRAETAPVSPAIRPARDAARDASAEARAACRIDRVLAVPH